MKMGRRKQPPLSSLIRFHDLDDMLDYNEEKPCRSSPTPVRKNISGKNSEESKMRMAKALEIIRRSARRAKVSVRESPPEHP